MVHCQLWICVGMSRGARLRFLSAACRPGLLDWASPQDARLHPEFAHTCPERGGVGPFQRQITRFLAAYHRVIGVISGLLLLAIAAIGVWNDFYPSL